MKAKKRHSKKRVNRVLDDQRMLRSSVSSTLKLSLAIALLFVIAFLVRAGDIILGNDQLNVSSNFYVDSSGNVGIGTTSPERKLDVIGSIKINTNNDRKILFQDDAFNFSLIVGDGLGNERFYFYDEDASKERFTISRDGNVGIGTTSPGAKLRIKQSSDSDWSSAISIENSAGSRTINIWADGSGVARIESGSTGQANLAINTGGGNVGIGTTSPERKLDVIGSIKINTNNDRKILFQDDAFNFSLIVGDGLGNERFYFYDEDASKERFTISRDGNVGIGTTSPAGKLEVIGDIRAEQICDETGANCKDLSQGLLSGWEKVSNSCNGILTCDVSCSTGKKVLGGGCLCYEAQKIRASFPLTVSSWRCKTDIACTTLVTYALCADVS